MYQKVFNREYEKLNKEQKKAVDTVEGPVMVIAGPGTGKTMILTLRIANILKKTQANPENILALTFTESGVYSMRKRLVHIIGSDAYKVTINTFHGFANEIIKNHPEEFSRIVGSSNLSEIDQIQILENILSESNFEYLKFSSDRTFYVKPILNSLRNLKREGITPDKFEENIKKEKKEFKSIEDLYHEKGRYKGKMKGKYKDIKKKLDKNEELIDVYRQYEAKLEDGGLYDYEDMIMQSIKTLEDDEDLLMRIQEKYQYVLVDEHQDTNNAQNKLLELILSFHDNPNVFIVGDEKQAIFRFQGASLQNFLYFKNLYPDAKLVNLAKNYRSTQTILDASHSVINQGSLFGNTDAKLQLRKKLRSQRESRERPIKVLAFANPDTELLYVIEDIQKRIKDGQNPSSIAVLYRDNRDVLPLSKMLEKTEIPFIIESNQSVLEDEDIFKLITLFRVLGNLGESSLLARVLHFDIWGLKNIDVFKTLDRARREKIPLIDVLKSKKELKKAGLDEVDKMHSLYKNLSKWSKLAHNLNFLDVFEQILNEAGFIEYIMRKEGSVEKMNKLENLFNEVRKIAQSHPNFRLNNFLNFLDTIENYNILIKVKEGVSLIDSIRLMTAHKSKGLEFETVYLIGATDKHWGNRKQVKYFHLPGVDENFDYDEDEDERRLFYVAITRAKQEVIITYSKENYEKEYQLVSQFVEEIDSKYKEEIDTTETKKIKFSKKTLSKYSPKKQGGLSITNREYLQNLFLDQGLSVTAVNNYLEDPWKYFFENLVRIPRRPSPSQLYGIAVHEALRRLFDKLKDEKKVNKKDFLSNFEEVLSKQPLSEEDLRKFKKRGKENIGAYYSHYKKKGFYKNTLNELSIAGVFTPIEITPNAEGNSKGKKKEVNILLKGKLDKVEYYDDFVKVVDYKTGNPRSRNYILGETKTSNGNYYRQLIFYKILLDKYNLKKKEIAEMRYGEIDFVEPNRSGKFKKEKFRIKKEEAGDFEKEIQRVAKEIYELEFWDEDYLPDSKYKDMAENIKRKS